MLRATARFGALVALLFLVIPAQADEIEPEPEPALRGAPEPEPALKPEPEVVPEEQAVSEPSWIPSIGVGFETFGYDVDSTIVNLNLSGFDGTQSDTKNQLMVRIGGELMGPMLEDLPGRPRLFVQGGVGIPTVTSERIFAIGDPDEVDNPELGFELYRRFGPLGQNLPGEFLGQGSRLDAHFQTPSWNAGLGIAFSRPISTELLLHIKPSFQYSAETIDFTGKFKTVFEPPPPGVDPPACQPAAICDNGNRFSRVFQILESNADASTTDHSIGPGLEVALVLGRWFRPIRISLFGQARFLWLISGTTTRFADSTGIASYRVVRDDFSVRGGGGVRFSWVGFD